MKVSYYPGCSLEGTAKEYGQSFETVARDLGIELHELNGWTCCGASSAHVTNDEMAVSLGVRNLLLANKTRMDLVVPCAACYQRLKAAEKAVNTRKTIEGIPAGFATQGRIRHIVDFIWEECGEQAIREKVRKPLQALSPVCYYGCLVTRPPHITDARDPEDPRAMDDILKSLDANVKNWSYKTDCCGGNLMLTHPELARKLVARLFDMALEAGANCIAVGCPMCHASLDTVQRDITRSDGASYNLPVYYFTELMGLAFGNRAAGGWFNRHLTDAKSLLSRNGLL
ncbi:MAG: CoB--CoM heterodisulfide reductase iron-sulfur subunit B family protein [Dehalococcoidia bacterium]|nr:CoB--CoM heterodisulfide reductase iron-sulfur subunit B family protein [Dehalococcoidia bacterium]